MRKTVPNQYTAVPTKKCAGLEPGGTAQYHQIVAVTLSALEIFSRAARADPYPIYERLREHAPVHYEAGIGIWFLSRYEDAATLLKEGKFSADRTQAEQYQDLARDVPRSLLGLDPPDHTR